ncbi:hypothetical protein [Lacihabitans soyangensis]|uniref:Uncharacterized protein n=1 Tax=Lacihabitans soyangensis TaxID=869394 RepID=A0AAE3H0F2_9BACT|nr:hypothetical protein [Lacihabitans soyangensis]MCP9762649.1 hypothetical protein [Lacihabitans soyangensis]
MKLKSGREEIAYLLGKVIEKFENETGQKVIRNSNRKNYEEVAKVLSEISNRLPYTSAELQHEAYPPETTHRQSEYPFRKYDITGNQIKDAFYNQIVTHPRAFLVDASYIYLFGKGRKGFEVNPTDPELLEDEEVQISDSNSKKSTTKEFRSTTHIANFLKALLALLLVSLATMIYLWQKQKKELVNLKTDLNILPYSPTKAEIDSLEGTWLSYTGSPQARSFDPDRYRMVVSNIVDVTYKNGYFTFVRYGSNFNHSGFMQFESPWLVSIHSRVKNVTTNPSPKHSLLKLEKGKAHSSVISASWNFDIGERNRIIGIREVYIKLGKDLKVREIFNEPENALCRCKIIKLTQPDGSEQSFQLKNESLESLPYEQIKTLLDENSLLLREPEKGVILYEKGIKE